MLCNFLFFFYCVIYRVYKFRFFSRFQPSILDPLEVELRKKNLYLVFMNLSRFHNSYHEFNKLT
jgi:hypothetical protein